jgi:hypothetical protein
MVTLSQNFSSLLDCHMELKTMVGVDKAELFTSYFARINKRRIDICKFNVGGRK